MNPKYFAASSLVAAFVAAAIAGYTSISKEREALAAMVAEWQVTNAALAPPCTNAEHPLIEIKGVTIKRGARLEHRETAEFCIVTQRVEGASEKLIQSLERELRARPAPPEVASLKIWKNKERDFTVVTEVILPKPPHIKILTTAASPQYAELHCKSHRLGALIERALMEDPSLSSGDALEALNILESCRENGIKEGILGKIKHLLPADSPLQRATSSPGKVTPAKPPQTTPND